MKKLLLGIIVARILLVTAAPAAERLDRGVVAVPLPDGGVYVGWRLLLSDPADAAFDVFRSVSPGGPGEKINSRPVVDSTNVVDATASGRRLYYSVRRVGEPEPGPPAVRADAEAAGAAVGFRSIKLQAPVRFQKCGVADLDGDGALDFVIKHPDFNVDPYFMLGYWKRSPEPYKLEAYRSDGSFLWRHDMGWSIETGIWYSPWVVYDVDGDGRAEVYAKAGEGDPREPGGRVFSGPEYLVKIDGRTGEVLQKVDWIPREPFQTYLDERLTYNRASRNLLGIAYLDGKRPHVVMQRGTYALTKVTALDPALQTKWEWTSASPTQRGQGSHGLQVADVDGDGNDEVVSGALALDDDGELLWSTGRGHPDVCYVADIDPNRPGLEVFYGHEFRQSFHGVALRDARTGKLIWGYEDPTTHVHGQGMVADIDATRPGMESYAGEKNGSRFWLYDATGELISDQRFAEGLSPRAVFWADGPTKVLMERGRLRHYNGPEIGSIEGKVVAIADCLGDWREEIITSVEGELRIYTTTMPATTRRVCLMQDRQYRTAVATQTMGYFYPPNAGGQAVPE